MKIPYMTNRIYRFFASNTPKKIKLSLKNKYNKINSFVAYGTLDMFTACDIEISSKCNLKCSYCPVSIYGSGDNYMPESLFYKIIDDLADINYEGRISPSFYGEPLLDDRIIKLLIYARNKLPKAQIIIHSNGTKITKQIYRELIDLASINGIFITKHLPNYPSNTLSILSSESDAKKYIRLREIGNLIIFNRGGTIEYSETHSMKRCYFISDQIAITYKGNVVCSNDFHSEEIYGNVTQNHLIQEIWESKQFIEKRKKLKGGKFEAEVCKKCSGKK